MLGMNKKDVCLFQHWDIETYTLFQDMQTWCSISPNDAETFNNFCGIYGEDALECLTNQLRRADAVLDFLKLDRYLMKQSNFYQDELRNANGLQMFIDYREMLAQVSVAPFTELELWPPHLIEAHDRLADIQKAKIADNLKSEFDEIATKWKALEWSDGHICTRLPKDNSELVYEGRVLHHCVGGYGRSHVNGRLVVFIRHVRRPERSWYTLNIDVTGEKPKEIQLHGYGNERIGSMKLHIPAEVRNFCNQWEKNVLTPVFQQVKAEEVKERNRIKEVLSA